RPRSSTAFPQPAWNLPSDPPSAAIDKLGPRKMRSIFRGYDTETRSIGGELDAVAELDARPRVLEQQQVPVQVDEVAETRDLRARGDAEPGLGHATEHDAEPERAGGMRHPHGLADAARLRELDVDPVGALAARGHIAESVAVLVDVDRERRRGLEPRSARIA